MTKKNDDRNRNGNNNGNNMETESRPQTGDRNTVDGMSKKNYLKVDG